MRLLIDTNVLISSEPTRASEEEYVTRAGLELQRIASGDHQLLVHPTISEEIANDRDTDRRRLRQLVRNRYPTLDYPPPIQPEMDKVLGVVVKGSHDWYDHLLLACVLGNAVHGLITQDSPLHDKARKLGVADRVYYVADAIAMLARLRANTPVFVPSVAQRPMHAILLSDPFFDTLRRDYLFDTWFAGAARDGRMALVIDGPNGQIVGLCILKGVDHEIGVGVNPGKISTFKVDEEYKGNRFGELLLKALFKLGSNQFDLLWITIFPRQTELIALLENFGFRFHDTRNSEFRYVKYLDSTAFDTTAMSPLDFHIAFGPPAIREINTETYVIPIQPRYHRSLFPDSPIEPPSLLQPFAHGNALRKAYLSHANIRTIDPGATILFYRSMDLQAITTAGVVEDAQVFSNVQDVINFVGSRTVYTLEEIENMVTDGPVLAILFRQDRFIEPPISLNELIGNNAIRGAPQSISRINPEGIAWLELRLGV